MGEHSCGSIRHRYPCRNSRYSLRAYKCKIARAARLLWSYDKLYRPTAESWNVISGTQPKYNGRPVYIQRQLASLKIDLHRDPLD